MKTAIPICFTKQKLLMHESRYAFLKELNDHLSNGWRIVPGTHVASLSTKSNIKSYYSIAVEGSKEI